MKCAICGMDSWRDLDHLRDASYWWLQDIIVYPEKVGFQSCSFCGYITYARGGNEEHMFALYSGNKYRKLVNAGNVIACNRKWLMWERLWGDMFKAKAGGNFLDYGMAQGAYLQKMNSLYGVPMERLYGTELTESYIKFAIGEYGAIPANISQYPKAEWKDKFDFILNFHVLEHVASPREKMIELRSLIKPDGVMGLSIPLWNCEMSHSSDMKPGQEFEEYCHVWHVNCFSEIAIENLFKQTGWEIVRKDKNVYDYSVLLKPCEPNTKDITIENIDDVVKTLEAQKKSCDLAKANKFEEAIEAFPGNISAYLLLTNSPDIWRDESKKKAVVQRALKLFPKSAQLNKYAGTIELQYDGTKEGEPSRVTSAIARAKEYFAKVELLTPLTEDDYHRLALIAYIYEHDAKKACEYWNKAVEINPMRWGDFLMFRACAYAGLDLPKQQPKDKLPINKTNVNMVTCPKFAPLAQEMKA